MGRDCWAGWRLWSKVAAFNVAYLLLVAAAYRTAWVTGLISPLWWPAAGLALGVLVRAPRHAWRPLLGTLAIVLGVLGVLGIPAPRQPPPSIAIVWAISDVVPPLLGAALILRFDPRPFTLQRLREVRVFLVCGVLAPSLLNTLAVLLAWMVWPDGARPQFVLTSVLGSHVLGLLGVAPLILTWPLRGERFLDPRRHGLEALALLASLLVVGLVGFELPTHGLQIIALSSATLPLLAWAAIRFGPRGAAWATVVLATIASVRTLAGHGPFVETGVFPYQRVSYALALFALAMISSLLIAAFAGERGRAATRQRLLFETAAALGGPGSLHERVRRVAVLAAGALASACEIRLEGWQVKVPAGASPHTMKVAPLPACGGALSVGAGSELGYLDQADLEAVDLVASRIASACEEDRLMRELDAHARKNEEALALLDAVLLSAPVGVALFDRSLRYIRVNEAMARINGLPASEHVGKRVQEVLPEFGPDFDARLRHVLESGQPVVEAELAGRTPATRGQQRVWNVTWFPITVPGGPPLGVGAIVTDVTERVELAQARERALSEAQEAVRIREDFLSIASHELKTPLTPLAARLDLIQRRVEAGQPVDLQMVQKARGALGRLTSLMSDLLDVSRIRAGRLTTARERVSLEDVVREVYASYREQPLRHRLELDVGGEGLWVVGERARLAEVVDTLVSNAIKFSPEGGRIAVSLQPVGAEVVLSVTDEGIGVPPGDQQRVFDRFFRARNASARSYGGLGLGLYISREIVEQYGGRMWLRSEVGRGSTFYVALPLMLGAEVATTLH